MDETIYIEKHRIGPVLLGTNYDYLIQVWEEALYYFKDFVAYSYEITSQSQAKQIYISLQGDEILSELKNQKILEEQGDEDTTVPTKFTENEEHRLAIRIKSGKDLPINFVFNVISIFIQELFLAMNISGGPCLDLTYSEYIIPEQWSGPYELSPPQLSAFYFESGWLKAQQSKWGWPKLELLNFSDTWEWFDHIGFRGIKLATQSVHKALFSFLYLESSRGPLANPSSILTLSQAIESLFSTNKENILGMLRERITLVLGSPVKHKNWINKFYDIRSRIIHGDHPLLRDDYSETHEYTEEFWPLYTEYSEKAFLVIIATIQDLIIHSAKGYQFKQSLERYN
jgi:hypothetical protein